MIYVYYFKNKNKLVSNIINLVKIILINYKTYLFIFI